MRAIWIVICVVAAVAGFSGYLTTRNEIDPKKADVVVKEWAEKEVAPVDKVDCPEGKMKSGVVLDCVVYFSDGKAYTAKLAFGAHDSYTVTWATVIVGAEKLAANIASAEKVSTNKDLTIDCGTGVIEFPAEGIQCTASAGNAHGHLRVKLDGTRVVWVPER